VEGDYRNSRGDIFSLDYRYDKEIPLDEVTRDDLNDVNNLEELVELVRKTSSIKAAARLGLFYNWSVGYSIEASIEDSKTVQQTFNLIYTPSCWSVEFAADQTPGNEKYTVMFRLANIGSPFGLDMPGL
jgi:LPS-assembly protein